MSIFSALPEATWVASNTHAFAVRDLHPVSPGHTLVLKRAETTLSFANGQLTVSSNGPEKVIEFEPADASRCAQFFAPTRTPYR